MSCDNSANRDHSHSHDHEQCAAPEAVAITSSLLEEKVRAGIANVSHVKATDLSDGCGSKFELVVVSSEFMGKAIIAQHRMIHKALEAERPKIHALTIKTKTPESWASESELAIESATSK